MYLSFQNPQNGGQKPETGLNGACACGACWFHCANNCTGSCSGKCTGNCEENSCNSPRCYFFTLAHH